MIYELVINLNTHPQSEKSIQDIKTSKFIFLRYTDIGILFFGQHINNDDHFKF
jgi:hypothetical protein